MSYKTFLTFILLLFLSQNIFAIRNGLIPDSTPKSFVKIKINELKECGGVRISKDYIISVAHCFRILSKSELNELQIEKKYANKARFTYQKSKTGFFSSSTSTFSVPLEDIIILDTALHSEIAVVKIPDPPKDDANYIAELGLDDSDLYSSFFDFYGLGVTHKSATSRKVRFGKLLPNDRSPLSNHLKPMIKTISGQENEHPCHGDSGSPLYTPEGNVIAIASHIKDTDTQFKVEGKTPEKILVQKCLVADEAYFVYLKEHMDFLKPYL